MDCGSISLTSLKLKDFKEKGKTSSECDSISLTSLKEKDFKEKGKSEKRLAVENEWKYSRTFDVD